MPATLTLDNFPSPSVARQLSPNGRADWHVKVGAKQVVRERVAVEVRRQGIAPIHGPVALSLTFIYPNNRRRDIDNHSGGGVTKVVIDALVTLGVIDADDYRTLRELSVRLDVQRGRRALMLMPARVALALQADGWWVRSDIAWVKTSAMPESVTDRPTNAWEHIFLLSRSARYFYDADAVRTPDRVWDGNAGTFARKDAKRSVAVVPGQPPTHREDREDRIAPGANLRNAWILGPEPLKEAHYAAFPTEIPRRAILAGTSERGACPACGAPWRRVTSKSAEGRTRADLGGLGEQHRREAHGLSTVQRDGFQEGVVYTTTGWAPTCQCGREDTVPCRVLDPFLGSGTTAIVAERLGRDCVGIELNPAYVQIAERRIRGDAPLLNDVELSA